MRHTVTDLELRSNQTRPLRLTVETGPLAGHRLDLDRDRPTVIGSGEACDLRLEDASVAAEHAVVKALRDEGFGVKALTDGGLTVNGKAVQAAALQPGDVLEVGPARIRYGEASASSNTPDIPGFKILGVLGQGGMGVVYRAEQISLHREVALKVLGKGLTADPQFVKTFIAEARAAAKLQHPNVVHVFDVGQHENTYYYTMEVMGDGSLEGWLKQNGKMPFEQALQVIADAAAGLAYAESLGMVHRDIKPDNLMLDKHGTVKIADLGLARQEQDSDEKLTGTPHFMAPEQLLRKGTDHRTDLYALGCTFYRLVTGRTAFRGKSVKDIVRAQVRDKHEPANKWNPDLPSDVCAIIDRLLEKAPEDRYQSAEDLLEELEVLLQPPTRKGLWIGLATAAVLITAGTIIWAINRPKETKTVEIFRDNPEAQRLAIKNQELEARIRENAATIALLEARLAAGTELELADALEAVATAHPDTEAGLEAKNTAAATRETGRNREQGAERRLATTNTALATLNAQIDTALAANDPVTALGYIAAAKAPADGNAEAHARGLAASDQRVKDHANRSVEELTGAFERAKTSGDIPALDKTVGTLTAILEPTNGWPAELLPNRDSLQQLLDSARTASNQARAATVDQQWQSYRTLLQQDEACKQALRTGDLLAAAETLKKFAADHPESPAATRCSQIRMALQRGAEFADALAKAAETGEFDLAIDEAEPRQVRRWDRAQNQIVLAASRSRGAQDIVIETATLSPDSWLAFSNLVPQAGEAGPGSGSRESFLAFVTIQAHLDTATSYLQQLSSASDESGTGETGYPLSPDVLETLLRRLPADPTGWQAELSEELQAARLLTAGLRALSERRNLAAAAHLDRLLGTYPNSIAVAELP
ncbi:MAG: protein kinase [Planctomycetota bacterium]|nr:protein kinase [Planctomycetota bacterium]